jgi:mannose-6-phosphate isomerase-like protein (cupin superfamily)
MSEPGKVPLEPAALLHLAAGADLEGQARSLGVSHLAFKLAPPDGSVFVVENSFHAPGGPARHLHHAQEEWFYALEGEFLTEVGEARFTLRRGESLLAPRRGPHVWAHVGPGPGRILIAFFPAGRMEAFFREVTRAGAMPPQDPALWREHGMELLGPPLALP